MQLKMGTLTTIEKIEIFASYIGNEIWIEDLFPERGQQNRFGILIGVQLGGLLIQIYSGEKLWFNLHEECPSYKFKLLLKPLSKLTQNQVDIANNLPAKAFISTYYIKSGFDMPVFIKPNHHLNCRYLKELDMADYRSHEEIINSSLQPRSGGSITKVIC